MEIGSKTEHDGPKALMPVENASQPNCAVKDCTKFAVKPLRLLTTGESPEFCSRHYYEPSRRMRNQSVPKRSLMSSDHQADPQDPGPDGALVLGDQPTRPGAGTSNHPPVICLYASVTQSRILGGRYAC